MISVFPFKQLGNHRYGWLNVHIDRCYRKLKKYNKSEEHLLAVINEDPFHPEIHYELGRLYHDMQKTK